MAGTISVEDVNEESEQQNNRSKSPMGSDISGFIYYLLYDAVFKFTVYVNLSSVVRWEEFSVYQKHKFESSPRERSGQKIFDPFDRSLDPGFAKCPGK